MNMNLGRRQFFEKAGKGALGTALTLAVAGSEVFVLEGCNVLDELTTWVPIGLAAFDGVASFIPGFSIAAGVIDKLWASLSLAIANYQHTTDPTTTLLDKVIAAMDALQSGLTDTLAALPVGISAAVLAATKFAFGLILSTLKKIQAKLEPLTTTPPPVVTPALKTARMAAIGGVPPAKDNNDFVKRINANMAQNGLALRLKLK